MQPNDPYPYHQSENVIRNQNMPLSPGALSQTSNYSTDAASKKENVQVYVRVRPPFEHELDDITLGYEQYGGYQSSEDLPCVQVTLPCWITLNSTSDTPKEYQFSQVFSDQTSQQEVFQQSALPLVFHVLNGYNGIYFVYGQTGTGKTHSMGVLSEITEESQGIIPSSIDFIFRFFQEQAKNGMQVDWRVHLSFFQIYQEQIQDLLNPQAKSLQVREEYGEVYVEDLVEVPVQNLEQAMNIINAGLEHRQIASQNMNATSSRSHTILQVDVYQDKIIGGGQVEQIQGRLTLVDLAGSERVRRTTSGGARLDEAKHINQSLSALGNVISGLANSKQSFIPYRSSKLTRVLQNALSGSSKVVVLSTVGPSIKSYSESLSTLQFAQRCKEIQLQPITHSQMLSTSDGEQVQQLKDLISQMEEQHKLRESELIAQLRQQQLEIERLKAQKEKPEEKQYNMRKVVQIADLTTFLVRLLTKLTENSNLQCNEVFDLNQQVKEMFPDTANKEIDEEFPFTMEHRLTLNKEDILEFSSNDEIIKHEHPTVTEMVQKLQKLAKKHVENLNFLAANSKNSVLLKQYVNEHMEDLKHKHATEAEAHKENVTALIKELICLKKSQVKTLKLPLEKRVEELREYILEYVMPMLRIDDLTKTQTFEIDEQIFNMEDDQVIQSMEQTMERQKSLISDSFNLSMRDMNSKQSNMDPFLQFQSLGSVQQENKIIKLEKILPSANFGTIPYMVSEISDNKYKTKRSMDSESDGGIIFEEKKESEASTHKNQKIPSRQPSEQNFTSYSNKQQMSNQRADSRTRSIGDDTMRADNLIKLSKGFLDRCFLKFQNYFLKEEGQYLSDSQALQFAICGAATTNVKTKKGGKVLPPSGIDKRSHEKQGQFVMKKPSGARRGSGSRVAHFDDRTMSVGSQDNMNSSEKRDSSNKRETRMQRFLGDSHNEQFFEDEMLRLSNTNRSREGSMNRTFYLRKGGSKQGND